MYSVPLANKMEFMRTKSKVSYFVHFCVTEFVLLFSKQYKPISCRLVINYVIEKKCNSD